MYSYAVYSNGTLTYSLYKYSHYEISLIETFILKHLLLTWLIIQTQICLSKIPSKQKQTCWTKMETNKCNVAQSACLTFCPFVHLAQDYLLLTVLWFISCSSWLLRGKVPLQNVIGTFYYSIIGSPIIIAYYDVFMVICFVSCHNAVTFFSD